MIYTTLLMGLAGFRENTSFLFDLVHCNEGSKKTGLLFNKQACSSLIIFKAEADHRTASKSDNIDISLFIHN